MGFINPLILDFEIKLYKQYLLSLEQSESADQGLLEFSVILKLFIYLTIFWKVQERDTLRLIVETEIIDFH
jgi:hypothetical protein